MESHHSDRHLHDKLEPLGKTKKEARADPDLATSKQCSKCHETKPIDSFSKDKGGKLGRRGRCKTCYNAAYRSKHRDYWRAVHEGQIGPEDQVLDAFGNDWSWAFVVFSPVPDYPGYLASSDGWVWSCWISGVNSSKMIDRWRRLKTYRGKNGYIAAVLSRNGKKRHLSLHTIILKSFMGPRPPGKECCHGNGKKDDNRLLNLRWDTHKSNSNDRILHGTNTMGERNSSAKLKENQVMEIRERYLKGETQKTLAQEFNVSQSTISLIALKKKWRHL